MQRSAGPPALDPDGAIALLDQHDPLNLRPWGWNASWQSAWVALDRSDLRPGRVVAGLADRFLVQCDSGPAVAFVAPALRRLAVESSGLPAVGDWVALGDDGPDGGLAIHAVLPRRTKLSRRRAGKGASEQILAANIDEIFVVASLDREFNPNRLERYRVLAAESGARMRVLLNKADLSTNTEELKRRAESVAGGTPVLTLSALNDPQLDELRACLEPASTIVLVGSSGVGKSTLLNRLLGEDRQATAATRASDARGRHTTSHRELVPLPGGALLIDTPGLREIQLWAERESLDAVFGEIERLAPHCRYRDCIHQAEPGCAVRAAVESGRLDPERLRQYHRMRRELEVLASMQDEQERRARRRNERTQGREFRRIKELRKKR